MKKLSFFGLGLMILLSSCFKEPKPEPTGPASVRILNAVSTSPPQDVYYNGNKMNIAPLAYGQVSAYQSITSGPIYIGFTDNGSTVSNYEGSAAIKIGQHFTVIYFSRGGEAKNVGFLVDDMTAPPAGKARVRFLNLNPLFVQKFSVKLQGGAVLTASLEFANSNAYADVDPGAKFDLLATGLVGETVVDANIQAGKIYTIWFDGTTTQLTSHVIVQN